MNKQPFFSRLSFSGFSVLPYLKVLVITFLTSLVLIAVRSLISPSSVALLYLFAVALSTMIGGLGTGVLASFLSFLAFNFFFVAPYYSLWVHQGQDLLALMVFLAIAILFSRLMSRTQESLIAATASEREALRLYELSTTLSGLNEDAAIVQTLARYCLETFSAERVEVRIEAGEDQAGERFVLLSGEKGSAVQRLIIPLESGRSLLGEIHIERSSPAFTAREERLARTFGSQSMLALERSRLARVRTRAGILEESDRLKSALLSSVSHEFRTPLATVKAAVTSLRDSEVPWDSEARSELLAAMDEETDYLNQLVSNLLNMTRIEAGALNPTRRWNVLAEIVGGVVRRFQARTGQDRFEVEIPQDLPLLSLDYGLMEQVFNNLIDNSLKYSPAYTPIRIRANVWQKEWVLVEILNQGPPVAEAHLERIFDRFFRVDATERVTGTGLGLSICKGLVEAHGGKIWAENRPHGFAFCFTLPLSWENRVAPESEPLEPEA